MHIYLSLRTRLRVNIFIILGSSVGVFVNKIGCFFPYEGGCDHGGDSDTSAYEDSDGGALKEGLF